MSSISAIQETSIDGYANMPSTTQQRVISSLQIPPSILSLIGSSLIMYNIRKSRKITPHRRIMFALSVCNIISTIGLILEPFLVPSDASPEPWVFAVGNDASCVMLGAISQFSSISQPMYLGFLSLYFLLTVKFGIKQRDFEMKYERWVHGFIVVLAVSTALGGIFLGFFRPNVVSPGCWINPPIAEGCGEDCQERSFAIIFGAVPSITSLLAIVICNGMLYVHVRSTVVEGQKKTISNERKLGDFSSASMRYLFASTTHPDDANQTGSETNPKQDDFDRRSALSSRHYAMSNCSMNSVMSEANGTVLRSSDKQWKRVRRVGRQAFLYVGAFLLTFTWSFAIHYLNSSEYFEHPRKDDALFPLMILQAIFLPALGFLNAIIFFLPKYRSSRRKYVYDCEPWWWVLEQVLTGEAEKVIERFASHLAVTSCPKGGMRKAELPKKKAPSATTRSIPRIPSAINLMNSMSSVRSLSIDDMTIEEEQEEEVLDPTETDLELSEKYKYGGTGTENKEPSE